MSHACACAPKPGESEPPHCQGRRQHLRVSWRQSRQRCWPAGGARGAGASQDPACMDMHDHDHARPCPCGCPAILRALPPRPRPAHLAPGWCRSGRQRALPCRRGCAHAQAWSRRRKAARAPPASPQLTRALNKCAQNPSWALLAPGRRSGYTRRELSKHAACKTATRSSHVFTPDRLHGPPGLGLPGATGEAGVHPGGAPTLGRLKESAIHRGD